MVHRSPFIVRALGTSLGLVALVGPGTTPVLASDVVCLDVQSVSPVSPGEELQVKLNAFRCGDGTPIERPTIRFVADRRCLTYDPTTRTTSETSDDQHTGTVKAQDVLSEASFPLPPACSGGITEIAVSITVGGDELTPSEPTRVLHLFDHAFPHCRELYKATDIARQDLRANLEALNRAALTIPIEGPSGLRELQQRYFEGKKLEDPQASDEAVAAALIELREALEQTPVEGPIELWWLSARYHHAKGCYRSYRM